MVFDADLSSSYFLVSTVEEALGIIGQGSLRVNFAPNGRSCAGRVMAVQGEQVKGNNIGKRFQF